MLMKKTKAQLARKAKSLGIAVERDWTKTDIIEAIELAQAVDDVSEEIEHTPQKLEEAPAALESEADKVAEVPEPTAPAEPELPTEPEEASTDLEPEITTTLSATPAQAPTPPPVAPQPPKPPAPTGPMNRAGEYRVLWTITLKRKPIHGGIVTLNDAEAKSLVAQGAVVHIDEYPAYQAALKAAKTASGVKIPPSVRVPEGAGPYRTVCNVTRKLPNCEIKVIGPGQIVEFTADEVASLAQQGAIECL